MKFFKRSLVALGLAATLPTVVFASLGVFYLLRIERERVESATLARAEHTMALIESRTQRDLAVLDTLSGTKSIQAGNWSAFQTRAEGILASNPDWASIVIFDAPQMQQVFPGPAAPAAPVHLESIAQVAASGTEAVGQLERGDPAVVWIYSPVREGNGARYVLAAAIRTDVFQAILTAMAPSHSRAALVDQRGKFIARSRAYETRVGTPAARFVRKALRQARNGVYPGETHRGAKNYTAFHASERIPWSTHIAVPASAIDSPTAWSIAVAALAGLGAALLAGVLVVLVLRDMAERRRADEALRQSQKMEAVGQLTGGIAHDFNNLLTAIIGNLDMIHSRAAGNERLRRSAANALEAARRGAKLAAQLLAFSRTQRMAVRRIDLRQLLNGMSGLLTQSVGPSIRVQVSIDEDAALIVSDANQLELALLNLAVNARDAMNGSGTLTITAKCAATIDRSLPPGDYVDLEVRDTGTGMSDEVRARAIEPFFTTKPTGQGTGLGLSQVYAVVRESGGALSIESGPRGGTIVRLTLRRAVDARDPPMTRPGAGISKPLPATGTESKISVLIVDDDRLVRRFMTESLKAQGYRVVDASDGQSAIERLQESVFDLLLVDFAMPGMNGAELARLAREMQAALRILIVSGYADSTALQAAVGDAPQLRKPFDTVELQAAVKELFEQQQA